MGQWAYNGKNGAIDQGYFVRLPDSDPNQKGANAVLINQVNAYQKLWVNELGTDLVMQGSTAQSVNYREFFPHNFTQLQVVIAGQTPNSYQYNKLAEFVRDSHLRAVFYQSKGEPSPVITLAIYGGGKSGGRNMKGPHQPLVLKGHIQSIKRGAEQFVNAPTYQFDFIIESSTGALFHQDAYKGRTLRNFTDFIKKQTPNSLADIANSPFVDNPDAPVQAGAGAINDIINSIGSGSVGDSVGSGISSIGKTIGDIGNLFNNSF